MVKQKVVPITGWEAVAKQMEPWGVVCDVFLGNNSVHPGTYKVLGLLKDTTGVGARIWEQAHRQSTFPTALLRLIQTEFTESFRQSLERQHRVHWPEFGQLCQSLAMGNFRLDNVALPGL